MLRVALLISTLLLAGCFGGGAAGVRLRVVSPEGEPVRNAHVLAVVLGRTPVPLPLTAETLDEALTKERISAISDADGLVRLELDADQNHVIFLRAPALGPFAPAPGEAGAFRFLREAGGSAIVPDPVVGSETPTLRIEEL